MFQGSVGAFLEGSIFEGFWMRDLFFGGCKAVQPILFD